MFRRLLRSLLLLIALSFVFFGIAHLTPGGVCSLYPQDSLRTCASDLELNASPPVQYAAWVGGYLHGDFGYTVAGQGVLPQILGAFPVTALLVLGTYAYLLLAGSLVAFAAAIKFKPSERRFLGAIGMIWLSLPAFWLALMLIYVLAVHVQVLPPGQVDDANIPPLLSHDWFSMLSSSPRIVLVNLIKHLILPAFTVALIVLLADGVVHWVWTDSLRRPQLFIRRTSRSARTKPRFRTAFADLRGPMVDNVMTFLPVLVSAIVIVEAVFNYGGLGDLFYTSLAAHDYATVEALLVLGTVILVIVNLIRDLLVASAAGRNELKAAYA